MYEDDLIAGLTQEVREEVIRNYLYERRLLEEQVKYVQELVDVALSIQKGLAKRFGRIYDLLMEPTFKDQFVALLGLEKAPFDTSDSAETDDDHAMRLIKVRALTDRGKYKKLLMEAYRRLYQWHERYKKEYIEIQEEIRAVNLNLKKFEGNYDLLSIIRFLKDMDVDGVMKKHFLGDNFTPEEMGSIEMNLRFNPIDEEKFGLIPPFTLPPAESIQKELFGIADCVFGECKLEVKEIIQGPY